MSKPLKQEAPKMISAGYFDRSAFKRKEKLLLVLKTGVAGLHFHVDKTSDQGKALLEKLKPGTELMLFRDVDNEHDAWAVSVYTKDDEELGYITRFKNETIARLMDSGRKFFAFVDEAPDEPVDDHTHAYTEDFDVPFSIYMEDV